MASESERARLAELYAGRAPWQQWGPYLADRAWGTVREDYSADGDAWAYFPHEHARSRAYRWNEDGLGGFCDDKQTLCLAVALWNERDPFLKERMFGLSNPQGNHGEDVKEYYFFLDGTPTHSYMKMLYKYPQVAYPYDDLVRVNAQRSQQQPEYELFDALESTFRANRYFDVFIEYAKAAPDDILCRVTAVNRGPDAAPLHVLPHVWFRNTWTWIEGGARPALRTVGPGAAVTDEASIGPCWWYAQDAAGRPLPLLFTENETNLQRLDGVPNRQPFVKDGIHEAVVGRRAGAVNARSGSKLAAHAQGVVPPGGSLTVDVRLSPAAVERPFEDFDAVVRRRAAEAEAFYAESIPAKLSGDERLVVRQALAGLLWSKQFYHYDVYRWLLGDPTEPAPPPQRWRGRNSRWKELHNSDVILMPDTWEYPWYASWDLAFHCVAMARVDPAFAKRQLLRMGYEWYQHANGQFPAYEWNFDDVNPPVTGWAAWRVYQIEIEQSGAGDVAFLREAFQNEILNFSFWVNRKDRNGRDVFGGGFLGMDNIGCFDRDQPLPGGGQLEQSDGTSWMALYSIAMLAIAAELSQHDEMYQNAALKYFEHFLYIAHAMTNVDGAGADLWDPQDEFYYDVAVLPDGRMTPLRVRSMVGLVPLFAVLAMSSVKAAGLDAFLDRVEWFIKYRPNLLKNVAPVDALGRDGTKLVALLEPDRLKAILKRMLDPAEFLSDYGIRALSRYHLDHPYVYHAAGRDFTVKYLPAESDSRLFGGNSNWRGPIWFPMNYMLVRAMHEFALYHGDDVQVECPTGSGASMNLEQVAVELVRRLARIFLKDDAREGRRAVWGDNDYFQSDPQWRDYVPFFEYFNGDTGAGCGASHQTGWTALIVPMLYEYGGRTASQ